MKDHKNRYSVTKMAKSLGVSRSGYYAWEVRKQSKRAEENLELAGVIRQIFEKHIGRYGSPRIWHELKGLGWRVSRKRVEKLMREHNLAARRRQKWAKTTDTNHQLPISGNILRQDFRAAFPGEKWVSDITYLPTDSGWLYLTAVIDLWDRKVIGWSIAEDLTAKQTCNAFKMAVGNRTPREDLIFHSDQGVQYCSEEFRGILHRLCPTARQSMSRKGNCWDNACAESFFKTLKMELADLKRRCSKKEIKISVFEYIEIYYNRCRRHSAIGYAIPIALTPNTAA
jgi:transposase InsO family protein